MRQTTLCFLRRGEEILLALKKRDFGVGKLNGVGGKVEPGETAEQAAIRETREEIGVEIAPEDLVLSAKLHFSYPDQPEWNQLCFVYQSERWQGEPKETDETKPLWQRIDALPFEQMWIDDPHWLPLVIAGKKIEATFSFSEDGKVLDHFEVRDLS